MREKSKHGEARPGKVQLGMVLGPSGMVLGSNGGGGGVSLLAVTPGSGAQIAGLKAGDRIVEIRGESLVKHDDSPLQGEAAMERLMESLEDLKSGDVVTLRYVRDGKVNTVDVVASESNTKKSMWSFIGELGNIDALADFGFETCFFDDMHLKAGHQGALQLLDIEAVMGRYFGVNNGVLVLQDKRKTQGFLPGDIVLSIDGEKIVSRHDVRRLLGGDSASVHQVKVRRKGRSKSMKIATIQSSGESSESPRLSSWQSKDGNERRVIVRQFKDGKPDQHKVIKIKVEKDKP